MHKILLKIKNKIFKKNKTIEKFNDQEIQHKIIIDSFEKTIYDRYGDSLDKYLFHIYGSKIYKKYGFSKNKFLIDVKNEVFSVSKAYSLKKNKIINSFNLSDIHEVFRLSIGLVVKRYKDSKI